MAILELANLGMLAKLLVAARKIALDDDPLEKLKAISDLEENGKKLISVIRGSGLEGIALEVENSIRQADRSLGDEKYIADARIIFRQVLPTALEQSACLAQHDLDPEKVVDEMVKAISTSPFSKDFFSGYFSEQYFKTVMLSALGSLFNKSEFIEEISPQLWNELLSRSNAEASRSEERHQELLAHIRTSKEAERLMSAGVTEEAVIELARRVANDVDDIQQAWKELSDAMEVAARVQDEGRLGSNLGNFVDEVLRRTAELSSVGAFEQASVQIDQALELGDAEHRNRTIRLLDAGLVQDRLRRDAESAGKRAVRKKELETAPSVDRFEMLNQVFFDYRDRGLKDGLNFDLEVAISVARQMVTIASTPDNMGLALINLCMGLGDLGDRQSSTDALDEAINKYGNLLALWNESEVPEDWALAKSNLGNALHSLGAREASSARVREAVNSYKAALKVQTRDSNPLRWARIQNNLGNALQTLGERTNESAYLREAINCYEKALLERTRERVPYEWSATKNSLGGALWLLGMQMSDSNIIQKAIREYQSSLQERDRQQYPMDWAATQHNLGLAYVTLAEANSDFQLLEQAAKSFRLALEESTRDRSPFDWSTNKHHLAISLRILGQHDGNIHLLQESEHFFREALEVRNVSQFPLDWAATQNDIGIVKAVIAEHTGQQDKLREAITAFEQALTVLTVETSRSKYADTHYNLGHALLQLFKHTGDEYTYTHSKNCLETALSVFLTENFLHYSSIAKERLNELHSLSKNIGTD